MERGCEYLQCFLARSVRYLGSFAEYITESWERHTSQVELALVEWVEVGEGVVD